MTTVSGRDQNVRIELTRMRPQVPCPWLNDKHTCVLVISQCIILTLLHSIFGRAVGGLDIIHEIENVKVDKNDKPWEDVKMMSISVE